VTVNLATGETHEHRRDDLITRVTTVDYKPGAAHSDWTKALSALPEELHEWYQLRMGQALTGKMTPDGKIIFQVGHGENGKSAVLDTVRYTLGGSSERGYSLLANRSTLAAGSTSTSGINSALASFESARLAIIEELDDGHFLSTTALKDLADTATISARHPYQRQNAFEATHSLFVNSNYLPSISEVDDGTWRRLLLVNFPYKFNESAKGTDLYREPDDMIKERLRTGVEQREACLAWLVEGALAYHTAEGAKFFRDVPVTVQTWTKGWRAEADLIMLYIETFLVFDPDRAVRPDDLREHFNSWAAELGHKTLTRQKFNTRFAGHTLITTNNVERDKAMRTNALRRVISYPPGAKQLDGQAKLHKVWVGFRYRAPDDDARDAGGQWGTDFQ
jgi:putative DNA primase/helicase